MLMTGRLFWVFSFFLIVAILHLSMTLFLPRFTVQNVITTIETNTKPQRFAVVNSSTEQYLQVDGDRSLVHAVCMFDVTDRAVEIIAPLPTDYWSISIYGTNGDTVYTLNDRQLSAERLQLIVKRDQGSDDEGQPAEEFADVDSALQIKLGGDHRGFAVLRALAPYKTYRSRLEALLERGQCAPIQSLSSDGRQASSSR